MDWSWFYAQTHDDTERAIAMNGGTTRGLDECIYCGRLFVANGTEQCAHCDKSDTELSAGTAPKH